MTVLMAGLPDGSAWHRFCQHRDSQPIADPDEAKTMLTEYYPGLGG